MRPLTEVWPLSTTSHCPVVGFHMRRVQSPDPLTMRPSPSTATDVTTCATHHHAAAHPALLKHDETQDSAQQPMFSASIKICHHDISSKTLTPEESLKTQPQTYALAYVCRQCEPAHTST